MDTKSKTEQEFAEEMREAASAESIGEALKVIAELRRQGVTRPAYLLESAYGSGMFRRSEEHEQETDFYGKHSRPFGGHDL